jgi:hypothetical protein
MPERLTQIASGEGTEVENTTTEGSLYRKVFAKNELQPGKVYRMLVPVNVNDSNSTDTCALGVRFGSSDAPASNTACGVSPAIDAADNDRGLVEAILEVHSTTRAICYGWISPLDAANVEDAHSFGPVVLTIAPDTAYNWDATAVWSVAHADNEVAAIGGHVSELVD